MHRPPTPWSLRFLTCEEERLLRQLLSLHSPSLFIRSGLPWHVAQGRQMEHELHPRAGSLQKATLASDQEDWANVGCT